MKSIKRVGMIVLVMLLCVAMVACTAPATGDVDEGSAAESADKVDEGTTDSSDDQAQEQATDGDGVVTVGYSIVNTQSPYAVKLIRYFEQYFGEKGWEMVVLDAEYDPAKQASQMDNLISRGDIDLILVLPTDGKAIVPSLKKAKEAGIPVIVHNSGMDPSGVEYVDAFIAPNCYRQGEMVAEIIAAELDNKGIVAYISGTKGYQASDDRENGFVDKITEIAPDIELIGPEYTDWQREATQTVMENYLTANDHIDAVYPLDDNMAMGAINAIKEANRQDEMFVVSIGGQQEALDAIAAGDVFFSTIYQSAEEEVIAVIKGIEFVLAGEPVGDIEMGMPIITIDNAGDYEAAY